MTRSSRQFGLAFGVVRLRAWLPVCAGLWLVIVGTSVSAQSQEPSADSGVHPLALKQEMVRDRFERFQDRLFRLHEQLAETEPENAKRLRRVLDRSGELGLSDQLDRLVDLLQDPSSLDLALEGESNWMSDADRLLAILLERDGENQERKDEIDRLQAYNEKLDELLEQERALRDATSQTGMTSRMLDQINQAIRRIEALQKAQGEMSQATQAAAAGESSPDAASEKAMEQRQAELAREAEQLAEDLEKLSEMKPDESADTPELESAREDTQSAAQAAQSSAKSMSSAGESMKEGQSGSAQQQQQQAEEALQEAKEKLEEAKRKLEEQSDPEKLAEKQEEVAEATGQLSEQMKQDAAAQAQEQGGQSGQSGQPGSPSPPGQQSLEKAKQEMGEAAESLNQQQPQQATESQDKAIEELEQAKKELEEALNQLREEEKEETLRDLEARFRDMLSKQRGINDTTEHLAEIGLDAFKRAEKLALADLSSQQQKLAQEAAACLHILDEDGTTIVFPRVVQQIGEDMVTVADRLGRFKVAALTQSIEAEIIDALEQLLEAVQQMQQENEQNQGEPQEGESGESPLLPPSAELKLLRASQVRINGRTEAIETAKVEQSDSAQTLSEATRVIASRQRDTAKVAEEMRDSIKP